MCRYIYACSFHKMPVTEMHITYIFSDHKNMGYASRLALGRRWVSRVSTNRLLGSLLHEDLLLIFLNNLIVFRLADEHEFYQFMIYMK